MTLEGSLAGLRVGMLVRTTYDHDARVQREAAALSQAGAEVTVFAYATDEHPSGAYAACDGVRLVRVDSPERLVPTPWQLLRWLRALQTRLQDRPLPTSTSDEGPHHILSAGLSGVARSVVRAVRLVVRLLVKPILLVALLAGNRELLRQVRARSFDVIHAHDWDTLWVACRAAAAGGCRLLYDSHELAVHRAHAGLGSRIWAEAVQRWAVPRADAVIAVSESLGAELSGHYQVGRLAIVRNTPVSSGVMQGRLDLRRQLRLPATARVAMYVGSLDGARLLDVVVDALALLSAEHHVVMMGPGSVGIRDRLERAAREAGVLERFHVLPPVPPDAIEQWVAGADVGIVPLARGPRNHEVALPNKLFQYLTAGVPVAVSDLRELARFVAERGCGVTFDEDPRDLARALEEVLMKREQFAAAAVEAGHELTWAVEQGRLLGLYRLVLRTAAVE